MTNANPDEVLVADSDGVAVEKSFEPDDFPVPAIAFALRSDRDEAVSVRLVDTVPDDVSPENIGFHPKYGAEFWDVSGEKIVFERELAPGEEYTTVYGLRGDDADVPSKFMSDPRIESVTPRLGDDTGGGTQGDRETPTGAGSAADTGSVGGVDSDVDDAEPDADDAETELSDAEVDADDVGGDDDAEGDTDGSSGAVEIRADPGDDADSEADSDNEIDHDSALDTVSIDVGVSGEEHDDPPTTDPDTSRFDDDSLLSELIDEIEGADPDDPEIVALRDALGIDPTKATVEARIDHLQSAVSDLEAYTDALEAFLDENGDAQRILGEIRERYEETTTRLDRVETATEEASESIESIESQVDSELEEVRSEMADLEAEIESLSEELSDVVEMRERLTQALGGVAGGSVGDGDDTDSGT